MHSEYKMNRKLHYFHVNGLAESIRYMLHYKGIKFEDVRYDRSKWPIKEVKDALPYGGLPFYEEGDRKLNQSIAIARYIASQTGLLPSDPWDQAVLDAATLNIYDLLNKFGTFSLETDPEKKEKARQVFLNETVDFYLSRIERDLKANNGFFGGKLTWSDFILVGIIETFDLVLNADIEKKYPTIINLMNHVRSLPGVKEYIATRKPYTI